MRIFLSAVFMYLLVLAAPQPVFACSFEVFCNGGGECAKSGGALYNTCLEGLNSDNNDKKVRKIVANNIPDTRTNKKSTIQMFQEYFGKKKSK